MAGKKKRALPDCFVAAARARDSGLLRSLAGLEPTAQELSDAILECAGLGYEDGVKALLAAAAAIQPAPMLHLGRALAKAAGEGSTRVAAALLRAGADPDAMDGDGWSASARAAKGRHLACLKMLRKAGAAMEWNGVAGVPGPLVASAWGGGDPDCLAFVLGCGVGVDEISGLHGRSALHAAASSGDSELIKLLLDAGADSNLRDGDGVSALGHVLTLSRWKPAERSARLLLAAGADPDVAGSAASQTPLSLSMEAKAEEVCMALVQAGAKIPKSVRARSADHSVRSYEFEAYARMMGLDRLVGYCAAAKERRELEKTPSKAASRRAASRL